MAGYPLTGELAKFNSVTSATDLNQLLVTAIKSLSMTFNANADSEDVSGDGDTATKYTTGLYESTLDFEGVYPKAAPRYGNSGLVTFGGGYAEFVYSYVLDFDFGEEDITSFSGTAPTARAFRPSGRPQVRGSYTARPVSGNAVALPSAVNSTGSAATFKLTEDSTDPAFTGSIIVTGKRLIAGGRSLATLSYDFMFADTVTAVAGTTLPAVLPAGAVDVSDWDLNSDGVADVTVVWQTAASRTYSAACFLRSLRVECGVGDVVKISGTIRNTGAVTLA